MAEQQKVTVYIKGEFFGNIIAIEGVLFDHGTMKWAQYPAAPFVEIKPKRKRSVVQYRQTYKPYLLIVEGWNQPKPDGLYGEPVAVRDGVTISKGRYMSSDPRWQSDFSAMIDAAIADGKVKVVADYRNDKG